MKLKKYLFLFLFLCPIIVKANSVSIDCGNGVATSNSITCSISGNADKVISAISVKVSTDANLSFASFTKNTLWQGDGEGGSIDLYTSSDVVNNFGIGTVTLNVKESYSGANATISLDNVFFYDIDGNEIKVSSVTKAIRIASSNNNLSDLSLSNGTLNPTFNKDTLFYSTTINSSKTVITAKKEDAYSSISGDIGTKALNYGNNVFKINVTSESGSIKTYTISIIRPEETSNNNNNNNNNNTIKSVNNYLKDITLSTGNILFDKNIFEYEMTVDYDVENIAVNAISEDSKSTIEITGNDGLVVGENIITIKVTSESGDIRTYLIKVIKKEEGYAASSNKDISNIIIKNYDFDFSKNKLDYSLKIKNEDKLDITVVLEDSKSKYTIYGNSNLKNKSVITIKVLAEDNTSKTYTINIIKKDIHKLIFIVIIIVLILINIIRIISFYLWRKEYEKNNN